MPKFPTSFNSVETAKSSDTNAKSRTKRSLKPAKTANTVKTTKEQNSYPKAPKARALEILRMSDLLPKDAVKREQLDEDPTNVKVQDAYHDSETGDLMSKDRKSEPTSPDHANDSETSQGMTMDSLFSQMSQTNATLIERAQLGDLVEDETNSILTASRPPKLAGVPESSSHLNFVGPALLGPKGSAHPKDGRSSTSNAPLKSPKEPKANIKTLTVSSQALKSTTRSVPPSKSNYRMAQYKSKKLQILTSQTPLTPKLLTANTSDKESSVMKPAKITEPLPSDEPKSEVSMLEEDKTCAAKSNTFPALEGKRKPPTKMRDERSALPMIRDRRLTAERAETKTREKRIRKKKMRVNRNV
ncbi:uncharacterized protein LOC111266676 [Varroa jacobsoni]|uniref:uncharacterized protein LOC111266676 n=1 Tax=Varroa jacobsoni TaxID=62625 RepID=UPI000BF56CD0|nr:uncharacterized protein LOC111266676 [Varroa jacobsoni]